MCFIYEAWFGYDGAHLVLAPHPKDSRKPLKSLLPTNLAFFSLGLRCPGKGTEPCFLIWLRNGLTGFPLQLPSQAGWMGPWLWGCHPPQSGPLQVPAQMGIMMALNLAV